MAAPGSGSLTRTMPFRCHAVTRTRARNRSRARRHGWQPIIDGALVRHRQLRVGRPVRHRAVVELRVLVALDLVQQGPGAGAEGPVLQNEICLPDDFAPALASTASMVAVSASRVPSGVATISTAGHHRAWQCTGNPHHRRFHLALVLSRPDAHRRAARLSSSARLHIVARGKRCGTQARHESLGRRRGRSRCHRVRSSANQALSPPLRIETLSWPSTLKVQ